MTNLRKQGLLSLCHQKGYFALLLLLFFFFSLNYPQIYGQHREHINLYQMAPGRHVYSNKYHTSTSNRCILPAGCNSLIIHSLTGRNESFFLPGILLDFFVNSLSVCAVLLLCCLGFGKKFKKIKNKKKNFYQALWLNFKMNPQPFIMLQLLYRSDSIFKLLGGRYSKLICLLILHNTVFITHFTSAMIFNMFQMCSVGFHFIHRIQNGGRIIGEV